MEHVPKPDLESPLEHPAAPQPAAGAGLEPPRLPVRAAIYIAPDGTVHFGALFEDLAGVAESLVRPGPKRAVDR